MAEPFLSEIRIFGFNFAPKGWAMCNGQLLPINQNQALFSLLGTTYGGNGQTTFALPNFQGKVPIHSARGYTLGQTGGAQAHSLTVSEMPAHNHVLQGSNSVGDAVNPRPLNTGGAVFARDPGSAYGAAANLVALAPGSVTNVGGSQPHQNMQPYLTLNFCIALQGIFPTPN